MVDNIEEYWETSIQTVENMHLTNNIPEANTQSAEDLHSVDCKHPVSNRKSESLATRCIKDFWVPKDCKSFHTGEIIPAAFRMH